MSINQSVHQKNAKYLTCNEQLTSRQLSLSHEIRN